MAASRALVGVAARSLSAVEADVTLPQYRALVLLSTNGDQNVGKLADALGIHASSVTRLCDRLLAKDLIGRSNPERSRREVTVTLSPAGHALVRAVTMRRRREIRRIVRRLEPRMQKMLVESFDAFAVAAGEVPDDAWKLGWTA